ncbi:MAG: hypothetical protein HZB12_01755 [Candidatus Yonathbacteria bacterium]|nr:hypothetical protein [Candidatus Yonathbacteria bacterium]
MFSFFKKPIGKIFAVFLVAVSFLLFQNKHEATAATSFVGASNLIATNGSAPGAITPNAGTANGDLLVFYHYSRVTGGNETVTLPAGFTGVFNSVTANRGLVAVGWRVKQAGDTAFTASVTNHSTGGSGETIVEWIETFRGTDTTSPIVNFTASLSTWTSSLNVGPISAPATAIVADGDMVVVFGGRFDVVTGQTVLSGDSLTWATRTIDSTTSGANGAAITQTGFNATGSNQTVTTKTITTTGTTAAGGGRMFIIKKAPDTTPPTPNPMTFASLPANDSAVQISMTATTASDPSAPVNYLFTNDNSSCGTNAGTGGTTSLWQSTTSYSDSGLQANKCYGYTITARDSAPTPNVGTASAISSTYTSANVPGTPTLSGATANSLNLTNAENGNPALNPTTNFAVQVVTTSDATWLNKWVSTSGNPSSTAVWMTDAQLDALVLQGLQSNILYGVKVKARNQDTDETALSAEGQGTTASIPASGTVSASPSACTISSGGSICTVPFTWSITNATSPNLYNASTSNQYSTATSGSGVSFPITNGANTVQVRDGSTVLNSTTATGSCTAGTTWNGATCSAITFAITATTGANGTTTPSGTTNVPQGGSQEYSITPDSGYDVETLLIDGGFVATSTSYTFTDVQATHTIHATFALLPTPPVTHTITASAGSNGSVAPLGVTVVADHGSQGYTIAPYSGFVIETLVVDSVSIATSTSYTFTDVTADHTISATFALIPPPPGSFTIIATAGAHGSVLPSGSTVIAQGNSQAYTITPNTGYDVESLLIDSFAVATSTSHSFTNVQANHTIEATFRALPAGTPLPDIGATRATTIIFSGKAFPGGIISVVDKQINNENVLGQKEVAMEDGSFSVSFVGILQALHSFGLIAKDTEGRASQSKFFFLNTVSEDFVTKDLLLPPTIEIEDSQVTRGNDAVILGSATPGYTIHLELDGILSKDMLAGKAGAYRFEIPTGALKFGAHTVRTKQLDPQTKKTSDFSTSRTLTVSHLVVVQADLNNDGKMDIRDWSIFLTLWGSKNSSRRDRIDFNKDGKIDISDFSIFIKTIRKK